MKTNKADIERGCRMVYEYYNPDKCWHVLGSYTAEGGWENGVTYPTDECIKCGQKGFRVKNMFTYETGNPPLATSLDAWAEHIWPVMDDELKVRYVSELGLIASKCWADCPNGMMCNYVDWNQQTAIPLYHVYAALKAAGLWDEWERGRE